MGNNTSKVQKKADADAAAAATVAEEKQPPLDASWRMQAAIEAAAPANPVEFSASTSGANSESDTEPDYGRWSGRLSSTGNMAAARAAFALAVAQDPVVKKRDSEDASAQEKGSFTDLAEVADATDVDVNVPSKAHTEIPSAAQAQPSTGTTTASAWQVRADQNLAKRFASEQQEARQGTEAKEAEPRTCCESCAALSFVDSCDCFHTNPPATPQDAAAKPSAADINREANNLAVEITTNQPKASEGGPAVSGDSRRLV